MADPANDFIRDYQTLTQQSWDAWTRQFQQPPVANPFAPPPAPVAGNDTLERTLAGLKGYFDWMQAAASGGTAQQPSTDWRQQLQQMFGGASQPFAQAFGGIDSAGAEGFARQWQSWMQAARPGGFGDLPGAHGPTPAFGLNREQQMQQQALATALLESMQATARYQELIQRANTQGMQRLQDKLARHAEPGRQIDSLKGLYDLWVDASEEAYAEIALSDEFREVYGEMVNTQMRVRQLQQQQTEQLCQQLGVPTRSEVSSLGERLQALRREFRASRAGASTDHADEIMALRRELAALKRQVANGPVVAKKAVPAKPSVVAKKTAAAKAVRKPVVSKSSSSPRKRK
ncbi:poly(R)-hydroxyalkanoic acid synthase subunit PhaE [Rhodanobacter thiooxydans]|uniref:poly(R)-hydroxyalkanoic acid synthase subunit PhaE n=1 Tax=Rhodanobacter thiooxydans TaxID=416169 RepID=UPI000D39C3CC|nr:poly(R)-hydroxyalkanoic acid synthase subunit PhaE [Rhodanobacter thiooxydans]